MHSMKSAHLSIHHASRARYSSKTPEVKSEIISSFPKLNPNCNAGNIADLLSIIESIQRAVNAGNAENDVVMTPIQQRLFANRALPEDCNRASLMQQLILAAIT